MAGSLGNLGGVSYDIVSEDRTGEGLDSARSGFVVTAGDIIAEIEKVDAKLQEFAKTNAVVTGSSERVSIISGLEASAIQNLAVKYADAATPISEILQIEEYLAKQHVTSIEQMDQLIPRIDTFGEANRTNSVELMGNLVPALKNFNIAATDTTRYMEPLTYLFSQTGINANLYSTEMKRVAPVVSGMNISFEDTNALLLTAYNRYGDGRTALTMLTKGAGEAEKQNLTGKAALDYMTQSMELNTADVDKNRNTIQNHIPTMDRLADAQRSTFTATENLNESVKNSTLAFGDLTEIAAMVSGPVAMIGQGIMGLAILNTLAPALVTSITGALSSVAGSISGAAGPAIAGIGGSIVAGIAGGLALGLAGVWTLDKLGIIQGIDNLGREIESSPIGGRIMDAMKVVLAPIGALGVTIIDIVRGDFAKIPGDVSRVFDEAGSAAGRLFDPIISAGAGFRVWLDGAFSNIQLPNDLGSAAQGLADSINRAFSGIRLPNLDGLIGSVQSTFSGIGQAFSAMAGQVQGVFSQLMTAISTLITGAVGGFFNLGQNILMSIVNGIIAAAGGIPAAIGGAMNQVAGSAVGAVKSIPVVGNLASMLGFAEGGVVPGPIGAPVPAMVHGGERVIPVGGGGGGSVGGDTFNIIIQGSNKSAEQLYDEFAAIRNTKRKQKGY